MAASSSSASSSEHVRLAVNLFSTDAEAHTSWIEHFLGGTRKGEMMKDDKGKVLHGAIVVHGVEIYLGDWGLDGQTTPFPAADPSLFPRAFYININLPPPISEVNAICDSIKAAGKGEVMQDATDEPWGARTAVIRDPFGHDWRLCAFPPSTESE